MQPLSGPGVPAGDRSPVTHATGPVRPGGPPGEQLLSPAQRTTLERLIVRIMSLSTLKAPELWAGVRHEVGVRNDTELQSQHFAAAEHYLNGRLSRVQNSHATHQLLQQLQDKLPLGNNRQAVSDFIRQQFNQTVLSALTPDQLRQVLTMLQNGQMAIPQPQQTRVSDRTLLPAEQQALNQQVSRLTATTGESPIKVLAGTLKLANLKSGDPIPSRYFPLLTQYLQVRQTLSQHNAPTLQMLESSLKLPLSHDEQQLLEDYSQQRFQATPHTVLTSAQSQDLLNLLFSLRMEKIHEQPLSDSEQRPQPLWSPFAEILPRPLAQRPILTLALGLALFCFLCWLFL